MFLIEVTKKKNQMSKQLRMIEFDEDQLKNQVESTRIV